MSAYNKIPRGLRVLLVMAILGILVWRFATNTDYYYYAIGAAIILTALFLLVTYHKSQATSENEEKSEKRKQNKSNNSKDSSETDETLATDELAETQNIDETQDIQESLDTSDPDVIPIEPDYTDIPAIQRTRPTASFSSMSMARNKPQGTEVAAWYMQMAKANSEVEEYPARKSYYMPPSRPAAKPVANVVTKSTARPVTRQEENIPPKVEGTEVADSEVTEDKAAPTEETTSQSSTAGTPSMPLVEDETTLTEEDKNELVNAVWYRCENPYCKYTSFLGVHHILDEKEGGNNRLDNLIVLCPYCHDLAHRHEIPEKEMREWISNREERFKFKPRWRYF